MNSNADYFRKELENIRESQGKLENSFADTQGKLKAFKSRINNVEIWKSPSQNIKQKTKWRKHESNVRGYEIICSRPIYE